MKFHHITREFHGPSGATSALQLQLPQKMRNLYLPRWPFYVRVVGDAIILPHGKNHVSGSCHGAQGAGVSAWTLFRPCPQERRASRARSGDGSVGRAEHPVQREGKGELCAAGGGDSRCCFHGNSTTDATFHPSGWLTLSLRWLGILAPPATRRSPSKVIGVAQGSLTETISFASSWMYQTRRAIVGG